MRVSESNNPLRIGFENALFGQQLTISRAMFNQKIKLEECSWIFDDHEIRQRMKAGFSDIEQVENMID